MVFLPNLMSQMGIPNRLFNKHLNHLKPIACIPGFKHRMLFKLWVNTGQEGFFFLQFLAADLPPPMSGMAFVTTIPTVATTFQFVFGIKRGANGTHNHRRLSGSAQQLLQGIGYGIEQPSHHQTIDGGAVSFIKPT